MERATKTDTTMTCEQCNKLCQRFGKHRNGLRRFRCPNCKRTYTEPRMRLLDDMNLADERILLALRLLIEGNSLRSTERITDLSINTLMEVLVKAGEKCERLMGRVIVNVPCRDVECDEIWGYIGKKEGHKLPGEENDNTIGDAYCFIAIERHSKLVLNFALGRRDSATTQIFIEGLRHATARQRFQITTDGFEPYVRAIQDTLGDRCDFAQLIKV